MPIFDNLAKAAKDFFIEEGEESTSPTPASARPLPNATPPAFTPAGMAYSAPAPLVNQPEQRHLDHIQSLLTGNGKDFVAYTKMVKSLGASGLSGPILYQTAFNAFSAVTGLDLPGLLASAEEFERKLTADRNHILERHREKLGEIKIPNQPPSTLVQLQQQEAQLQTVLTDLQRQLEAKQQELLQVQQQRQQESQKATAAMASYELANAAAAAELQAHRQATQSFLLK
ncbi:hypothetical protein HER32_01250 [Hymenobacter sp. BT18]|uniref:hypothetical protein n=1 Tax=Hymenobacter sp. BT18 TaxID=2835648 RepID=UPI00143E78C3|nr:hypothetical protein [Hymenobacter sp. BT18]QIX59889.1 hypothetical protein HER32_01250 [Hymenobacter sp. BT18]